MMAPCVIRLSWCDGADRSLGLPQYMTAGAAGADLRANFENGTAVTLEPGTRALIPTGLRMEIPNGFEVQIRPRSGLALQQGISLVNSPGTIDADYRGPVGVIVINHGQRACRIQHGARIAQMIAAPVIRAQFALVEVLGQSRRGEDGFGSTGSTGDN